MTMLYNLSNDLDRERAAVRWQSLVSKGAMVDLTERRQRTLSQNAYLHLLLGVLAMEFGERMEYCKSVIFKRVVNPELFVQRVNDRFAGETEILRSSRDLTTEEMTTAIDRLKVWASQQGIYLPDANEDEKLRQIEWQIAKVRDFL